MADANKKKKGPSILPGNSPWERRALKSGNAMTPIQVQMHKAFVSGKKEAKSMAAAGNYKKFSTATISKVRKATTPSGAEARQMEKRLGGALHNVTTREQRVLAAQGLGKVTKANKIYKKKFSAK